MARPAFVAVALSLALGASLPAALAWRPTAADVETALIGELASLARGGPHRLEGVLGPIYESLPKNEHGRLRPADAAAALRAAFLKGPGWTLRADAEAPGRLLELVAERTNGRGLGLPQLAAVAGGLEELARREAEARLVDARSAGSAAGALRAYAEAYLGEAASGGAWLEALTAAQRAVPGEATPSELSAAALELDRRFSRAKIQECSASSPGAAASSCLEVSSLYSLCCRGGEELATPEPSVLAAAMEDFPGLWIFSIACFALSALATIGRLVFGRGAADAVSTEAAAPEAQGEAAAAPEAEGEGKPVATEGGNLLGSCLALVLLGGAAVALDLLDAAIIVPALAAGLVLLAAARLAPKQAAKAKKI